MTPEEIELEARKISEDIYDEFGEFTPYGSITLDDAIETVRTYGYEGDTLEEISRNLVIIMEGIL